MTAKIKAFFSTVWADFKDTWSKIKIYVFAVAALILTLEFRKLKEFLLAYQGKKEMAADNKQDQSLAAKEKTANDQADTLIKQSEALPGQQDPVTEDWYKGKK